MMREKSNNKDPFITVDYVFSHQIQDLIDSSMLDVQYNKLLLLVISISLLLYN
jgi:hypothetical protein